MQNYVNSGGAFRVFRSKWICKNWTKDIAKNICLKTDCWLKEIVENPPALNLVYTFRDFQPYADDFADDQFKFIGASIYARNQENEFSFPQGSQPVVYISLGTIVNKAKSFYKKCIKAFEHEDVTVIVDWKYD